jgi:phage tail-like protein
MPLMNPVPAFDFNVFMMDAKPASSLGLTDLVGAGVGIAKSFVFGAFAEASGLNAELETEEYREGGNNAGPHKFVKWGKYPSLVFKRGVTLNTDIWDWYYQVLYKAKNPVRRNGIVLLTDRGFGVSALAGGPTPLGLPAVDRLPVAVWFFRNALPEKLVGPSLNARGNEIAIETLELAHEGLYRCGPSMIPGIVGRAADVAGL